jgi:hypothetical protein
MKRILFVLSALAMTGFCFAQAQPWYTSAGDKVSIRGKKGGTGRTTGHIIMLSVTNEGKKPVTVNIPPVSIPSTKGYQGYIIPEGTKLIVPARTTESVVLPAFCCEPFLPSVPDGQELPPVQTWVVDDPLLSVVKNGIGLIRTWQSAGHLTTPFSADKKLEETVVTQHWVWVNSSDTYDPCHHWRSTLVKMDQMDESAVADLAGTLLRLGRNTGQPGFTSLPCPTGLVSCAATPPAQDAERPNVLRKVTGTGRTTGHIGYIFYVNPTADTLRVQIGEGPGLFIPSSGKYQSYVIPYLPQITAAPGEKGKMPLIGYCTDIHRPPVPNGADFPRPDTWVSTPSISGSEPPPGFTVWPVSTSLPLEQAVKWLSDHTKPPVMRGWDCPDLPHTGQPLLPGTDIPVYSPLSADAAPALAVPVLIETLHRILEAEKTLAEKGSIMTPFSGNREKERETLIQQTFWMYNAALEDQPYTRSDFETKTIEQYEAASQRDFDDLPKEQKDNLVLGVDDFWNSFQAVGAEAKILPKTPASPAIPPSELAPSADALFNKPVPAMGMQPELIPGSDPSVPTLQQRKPPAEMPDCACDKLTMTLDLFAKGEQETLHFSSGLEPAAKGGRETKNIISSKHKFKPGEPLRFTLNNFVPTCGKCNGKPCKPTDVDTKVTYGSLESDNRSASVSTLTSVKGSYSLTIPDDPRNTGVFITNLYACGLEGCSAVECEVKFLLVLANGECRCEPAALEGKATIAGRNNKKSSTTIKLSASGGDAAIENTIALESTEKVSLVIPGEFGSCSGCSGACALSDVQVKVFENTDKEKEKHNKNPDKGWTKVNPSTEGAFPDIQVLKNEKLGRDNATRSFTVLTKGKCKASGCADGDCAPQSFLIKLTSK